MCVCNSLPQSRPEASVLSSEWQVSGPYDIQTQRCHLFTKNGCAISVFLSRVYAVLKLVNCCRFLKMSQTWKSWSGAIRPILLTSMMSFTTVQGTKPWIDLAASVTWNWVSQSSCLACDDLFLAIPDLDLLWDFVPVWYAGSFSIQPVWECLLIMLSVCWASWQASSCGVSWSHRMDLFVFDSLFTIEQSHWLAYIWLSQL